MTERETVKQEIARLRENVGEIEWREAVRTQYFLRQKREIEEANRRIDYLTREYVARDIEYEPNF